MVFNCNNKNVKELCGDLTADEKEELKIKFCNPYVKKFLKKYFIIYIFLILYIQVKDV